MAVTPTRAAEMIAALEADLIPATGRLGKVRRYLRGEHDLPYMPVNAKREYRSLAERAVTNWLPLFPETFIKTLFVEGYRTRKTSDNAKAWEYWQANRLDARQGIVHRGALEYGTSYVLVLPGDNNPVIRPLPATSAMAWYELDDDEWPADGIIRVGTMDDGVTLYDAVDDTGVYHFGSEPGADPVLLGSETHTLGVTPLVRFRDRLDGEATGIIRPLLTLQNRINEIVFATLIAMQYASFRQRWATGLDIPVDEDGNPVEPFSSAVDRLWVTDDPEAKFGDFAQTSTVDHQNFYTATVKTMAAIGQIAPNLLTGDLVNLSADALAQLQSSTTAKSEEYSVIFGEAWESVFRLASLAAGDADGANDTTSQVRWRETEARSLAQTVDALGKMAQMLGIPVQVLWERIPGVTDTDVLTWQAAADATNGLGQLADVLAAQAAPFATEPGPDAADTAAADEAAAIKAKADALGSLIRAGAEPESAAALVELSGLKFTGAVPVSLRLPTDEAAALEDGTAT